ncbi:MAG: ammonium transporter, partial [Nitrosopumilus sp. B06]
MKSKNHKYALLLVVAVTITASGAMSQAFAQSVEDGMDGYVKGTSGIFTGNPNECWFDDGEGNMLPCRIDTGDTAWMLMATSMVLFMTPGVAFFYGGLARSKNVVNVLGMTLMVMGLMSVQWVLWGYSLAFSTAEGDANQFMGGLDYAGFNQVSPYAPLGAAGPCGDTWAAAYQMNAMVDEDICSQDWPGTVPHQLFAMFQGTFAIITPALIIGGLVDRIKFSAIVIFVLIWGTFVYDPIAHWVWGGGFIGGGGLDIDPDLSPSYALDFAGGTVVHISSGFAALAGALVLGRRLGYG